uniref:Uncharacterized protein n=1 Tax=Percolomonas cosmopolitus TaxID=63605 RepID=A0A7S1PJH0_9EUKA
MPIFCNTVIWALVKLFKPSGKPSTSVFKADTSTASTKLSFNNTESMVTPAPAVSSLMVSVMSGPEIVVVVLVLVRESVRMLPLSIVSAVILRVLKKLVFVVSQTIIIKGQKIILVFGG